MPTRRRVAPGPGTASSHASSERWNQTCRRYIPGMRSQPTGLLPRLPSGWWGSTGATHSPRGTIAPVCPGNPSRLSRRLWPDASRSAKLPRRRARTTPN